MTLKEYQEVAVERLHEDAIRLLSKAGRRAKMVFKAPTGAGKTVTTAAFIERLRTESSEIKVAFLWIAPNELHLQSLEAFRSFFLGGGSVNPIALNEITDTDEGGLLPGEILFLNWQSINREDNVFIRDNEAGFTLPFLIEKTLASGVEIIAVLDEAHLFASKGEKAKKILQALDAKIEIDVSATPYFTSVGGSVDSVVKVEREDVIEAEMIKRSILLNPTLQADKQGYATLDIYLLEEALQKREELKAAYKRAGANINPLLLIQLPNDSKNENNEDRRIIDEVKAYLAAKNINTDNYGLAIWLSKEKKNLEEIEAHDSPVDVLLFKQAIALGWDCPRAAVLLIYRELKQETFTIQTVGRILRMPEQKHYTESILNYGYVYTNLSKDVITVVRDDMDYIVLNKARRIADYQPIRLLSYAVPPTEKIKFRLSGKFYRECLAPAAEKYFEVTQNFETAGQAGIFYYNAEKLKAKMINLTVNEIYAKTLIDVELTGETDAVAEAESEQFKRTNYEIERAFERFCRRVVKEYSEKESGPTLGIALARFFEDYLQIDELSARKIMLYDENQAHIIGWIEEALILHDDIINKKIQNIAEKDNESLAPLEIPDWEVPAERLYNELYVERSSEKHALKPYYEKNESSNPEKNFVAFLEKRKDYVKWWYKNGERNKEDFAITYVDSAGKMRGFFVDYVICLQNDVIALFDTKTLRLDSALVPKHNALVEYIAKENANGRQFIGGVVVPEGENEEGKPYWRFPDGALSPAQAPDTSGWKLFDPVHYQN